MELFELLIFCLFAFLASSAPQKNPAFPYPVLGEKGVPFENATPFFKFDGIDYEELPTELRNVHYDCYGEHLRCIRNRNYTHEICAYLTWYGYGNYYSMCTMELKNCLSRVYWDNGVYGTFYSNDNAFFQGEGHECKHSEKSSETRRK